MLVKAKYKRHGTLSEGGWLKSQVPPKQPHEVLSKVKLRRTFLTSGADGGEGWRVE